MTTATPPPPPPSPTPPLAAQPRRQRLVKRRSLVSHPRRLLMRSSWSNEYPSGLVIWWP